MTNLAVELQHHVVEHQDLAIELQHRWVEHQDQAGQHRWPDRALPSPFRGEGMAGHVWARSGQHR